MNTKDAVQKTVNEIYQKHGEVKPTLLIEAARPKTAPAHNAFEWDNKKAGHEYRLMQARQWIRRVEIIVEERPEQLVHVPQIVVDDNGARASEGYYKPLSIVSADKDEFQSALDEAIARLNSAQRAVEALKASAPKTNRKPDFKKAEAGFDMVKSALR